MNDKIDLTKVKPGDEVTVRLTYDGDSVVAPESGWKRFSNSAGQEVVIHSFDIVTHTPKALSVGDRVRCPKFKANDATGEVLAVRNHQVWVQFEGYLKPDTVLLSDLERI